MTWEEMCKGGGVIVEGVAIKWLDLVGGATDLDALGLPDAPTLKSMVGRAEKLKLKESKHKGIAFHIENYAASGPASGRSLAPTTLYNEFVNVKKGAASCYENTVLPKIVDLSKDHVLVHQSMAPCTRCRAGYRAWAQKNKSTIVVSADDGYDKAKKDSVFLFSSSGNVLICNN